MPCYLKAHSRGEYVFDHGWADAYERAGGRYYPKLQCSIPFTPVTGRRLLARGGPDRVEREALLLQAAVQVSEQLGRVWVAHDLPDARGMGPRRRARLPAAHRPAIPLAERGLCELRGFPGRAHLAQAEGDPERTARGAGQRHRDRVGHGTRPDRGALGRVLRVLHGHWLAQMGLALSQPALLQSTRAGHGRPAPARSRQARRPLRRRRAERDRRARRSMAAIGARSRSTRSCISRSATTRPSSSRSRTGFHASRPARKARTSLPAAICRSRPTARTLSPTRACAAPLPTTSSANGARLRARLPSSPRSRRIGAATQ